MQSHRFLRLGISGVIFLVLLTLFLIPAISQAAPDTSPQAVLQRAWELAEQSGSYHFSSRVVQKTALTPSLANTGKSSRVETLYLDGNTDRMEGSLFMRIWQNGGSVNNPADAAEIRVSGTAAFGRVSGGEWHPLDNFTGSFAPGNDLLGFLAAAQNVQTLTGAVTESVNVQRYTFDLSGPLLTEYLRAQLEENLRREGKLPAGLHLSTPDQFRATVGAGEIWLDRDGLPLRLQMEIQYPQQKNGERVSVQVYTDFSNFNREALAAYQTPVSRLQSSVSRTISKTQQPDNLIAIAFLGLIGLGLLNGKSKHIYAAVVIVVIFSMVVTPLLQSYQVYAFYQEQAAAQRQDFAESPEIQEKSWNPHENRLVVDGWELVAIHQPSTTNHQLSPTNRQLAATNANGDFNDNDGDGLPNDDDPCEDDADCDDDGLTDLQETRLGTDPQSKDTDGDYLTDNAEVKGFWYENQWWYSNPLNADTNQDGRPDTVECEAKTVEKGEVSPDGQYDTCADTDGDKIPDLFDRDDDGDSVPDAVDISPYDFEDNDGGNFDWDNPLLLQVDGLTPDEPAFVDFQLRPEREDHLWQALNILDWPANDEQGQIQRKKGSHATFADIAAEGDPVAANASNGDMRLVPMLEIEMSGDTIPLQFTNPEIAVEIEGGIDATVNFVQNGFSIDLDFAIQTGGSHTVELYGGRCSNLGDRTAYYWSGIADGDSRNMGSRRLVNWADGEHSLVISNDDYEACVILPNIANGPYDDRMVDPAPLDPYGISVRERDTSAETLLAYVPLQVVADETGADRVAFNGRMHYWPASADWGETHKVRVVWLVQMLMDHQCSQLELDAGICEDGEWITDQTSLAHAYEEQWYLTGMAVQEDRGIDIAVVLEDPAQESENDRQYDESLWALAWGLDKNFLTGRDQDEDAARDITVGEIANRWDYPTNQNNGYANGDDELWGVPLTSTLVLTYAYEIEDEYIKMAMTETEQILNDHYLATVDSGSDAPTLLFASEAHFRAANLGSDATTAEQVSTTTKLTVQIDPEKSKLQTRTSLSWAPYRYADGEWESYPIDEYWDRMEVRYEEIFTEYADDPDYSDIRRGQVLIAKIFYLSMYRGTSTLVQAGEDLIGAYGAAYTDADLVQAMEEAKESGGLMARINKMLTNNITKLIPATGEAWELRKFLKGVDGEFSDLFTYERNAVYGDFAKYGAIFAGTFVMMGLYLYAQETGNQKLLHTLNGIVTVVAIADLVDAGLDLYRYGAATTQFSRLMGFVFVGVQFATWGAFVYQLASMGLKPGSMAANFAFATQVASTITGFILLAIAAIPVVGQIIAGIIALFDSLVMFICGLAKSENFVCRGISGMMTTAITFLIYAGNLMIDLDWENRLDIKNYSQEFDDPDSGMAVGNTLIITSTVESKVRHIDWRDTNFSILAGVYWWQYSDDNLRSTNLDYEYSALQRDRHEDLNLDGIGHENWDPGNDGEDQYTYEQDVSASVPLTSDGINQPITLYLNESWAIPAQECWTIPNILTWIPPVIPVCYVRTERGTSHVDVGENIRYDVFPATFDEFLTLTAKNQGYALAWSQDSSPAFPRLQDADGDGLRAKAAGGADPDDSTWDADGDNLSDYFEIEIGSDPQDFDSDDDQLSDYDEVIYGTDVTLADTDSDGLTDKEELDGWEFVYDFAEDGSQIATWVTADPLTMDGDNDTFSDFQEKTYGFHPGVHSEPNILTLASDVTELKAPHLLLRLDETANSQNFRDISGHDNPGTCTACPASGHAGKYTNAPYFGGASYITADSLVENWDSAALTFGGWVYPQAGMAENGAVLAFNNASGDNRNMIFFDKDTRQFYHYSGSASPLSSAVALDEWHHVMVVIDENDSGKLYVNGSQQAVFTTSVRPAAGGKFSIGQEWDGGTASNFFKGYLDEVVVIPAALTQAEVQAYADGRYNPEDLTVKPGDSLAYAATVENELFNRYAEGLLSTDFPAAFSELDPQEFVLNPQESATLSGQVAVGSAASGVYTLTQQADALITDWREDSNYAEALYHFSGSTTLLEDHSGSQPPRDGECSGTCPTLTDGRYGNGAAFNGTNQFFSADKVSEAVSAAAAYSFGGWVYPASSASGRGTILAFESKTGGDYPMLKYDYSSERFYYFDHQSEKFSTSTFAPDQWYHVVVVIAEGGQNNGSLYVNGIEEARFTPRYSPTSDGKFSLGHDWDGYLQGSHDLFAGTLDEIGIYPKALTYQEIQDLFNNPIFHLPLDEGRGATQFGDDSGFENDAFCQETAAQGDACPTAGEEGLSLAAVDFDGSQYLSVDGGAALDLSGGDFAISTWVYPERDAYQPSACGYIYQYFSSSSLTGRPSTIRCDGYPLENARSSESLNSARWTGRFYFPEGTHTFETSVTDGYRVYVDGAKIFENDWDGNMRNNYDNFTHYFTEGFHTIKVESRTNHRVSGNNMRVDIEISPGPTYHPQGILGGDDYPTLLRLGKRLKLIFNDGTEFLTGNVLSDRAWNHVLLSYHRDTNTLTVYVDGLDVAQFPVTGETPAAGQHFNIGRGADTSSLTLSKLTVHNTGDSFTSNYNCTMDANAEFEIQARVDGVWNTLWSHADAMKNTDYALSVGQDFSDELILRMVEIDADEGPLCYDSVDDDAMGQKEIAATDISPYDAVRRFESNRNDRVDLFYSLDNPAAGFEGRIDEVSIYKTAFDSGEASELYAAGTLVLHLPLNDPPGSSEFQDALDQHNGACSGSACPLAGLPGRDEMALLFDGTDDTVTVSNAGVAEIQEITLSAWARLNGPLDGIMRLVSVGNDKASLFTEQGKLRFAIGDASSYYYVRDDTVLPTAEWLHIAATYDGATLRLYLDGVEIGTEAVTATLKGGDTVWLSDASQALDGYLDDVRVYRRALSAAQIDDLHAAVPEILLTLDETAGTSFADQTDNGHTGACSGNQCPDAGANGQIGLAALFDGENDRIDVPHDAALDPGDELTLAVWVKLTDTDPDQKLVGKTNNTPNRGYVLGIQDDQLYPEVWDSGGTRYSGQWGQINADYWTHLAFTYQKNGDLVGYINGNEVGRVDVGGNPLGSSTNPLRIGTAPWDVNRFEANGHFDHVTLYARALAPSEVREMFRLQAKWVEERYHIAVKLDNDAPVSTLLSDEIYRPNRDAMLAVQVEEATSGILMVEMGVSSDGGNTYTWQTAPRCAIKNTSTTRQAAWCPTFEPTIGEGKYLLQFRATDRVGNRESSPTVYTFIVDDTPPVLDDDFSENELLQAERQPGNAWLVALSGTVSDPAIGADPGSGVQAVSVKLTGRDPLTTTTYYQAATLGVGTWSTAYPLNLADPTGTYTLSAIATDNVSNTVLIETLVHLTLDGAAPVTSLDDITAQVGVSGTITTTLQLSGQITETAEINVGVSRVEIGFVPAAMASLNDTLAVFHFNEVSGAANFENVTGLGDAACSGSTCPFAGGAGIWGTGLTLNDDYNSADNYLSADGVAAAYTDTQGLSFGGWILPDYNPGRVFLAFDTAAGSRRNQIFYDSYSLKYRDSGQTVTIGSFQDEWGFVMVTIDVDGNGAAYLNGQRKAAFSTADRPDPAGHFTIGAEWDGSAYTGQIDAAIDEVAVYNRVLTPAEVHALYAETSLSAAGEGVLTADWTHTVSDTLDGLYQINLMGADVYQNAQSRDQWWSWTGEIDTRGPLVSLEVDEEVQEIADFADRPIFKATTTYTCWAQDFNLILASPDDASLNFVCPCQTVAPASTVISNTFYHEVSPWYAGVFTDTARLYETTQTCTVLGLSPVANYMKACDAHGRCTEGLDEDVEPASIVEIPSLYTNILTPTHNTILTSTAPINIEGATYSKDPLNKVEVKRISGVTSVTLGAPVTSICPNYTQTQTNWTQPWTPTEGIHRLYSTSTPCSGSVYNEPPHTIYVDTQPPGVSLARTNFNRQQRVSFGRINLTGAASDLTTGIAAVEVSIDGGPWGLASIQDNQWKYEWALGEEPDNAQYNVAVRATDRAGWTNQINQTVTVDLDAPNPITITVVTDGAPLVQGETVTTLPATIDLTWEASEPSEKLSHYEVLWTVQTTDTHQILIPVYPNQTLASSYPAGEAQRIEVQVTSVFTDGNRQVDNWGPVYVDTPLTPDYVRIGEAQILYRGWMDSGCSALGTDRRVQENAPSGAALNDPQNLYTTWDSEGLRITWLGGNWDYNGDLFIYLDDLTDPTVPVTATNNFTLTPGTQLHIPGAKAFIWVQDTQYAQLNVWDGNFWDGNSLDENYYRFQPGRNGGRTDLYIPFEMIGITQTATTPLMLYAFATDEGQMRLWATMPPQNPVNSDRVVETALYAGVEQALYWSRAYAWINVGPGVCPNNSLSPLPTYADSDLRFGLAADPDGTTYGLMSNELFWLAADLQNSERQADFSQSFSFMDVEHAPIGDGDTITYTLQYENRGSYTATNIIAQANALYALQFSAANTRTITVTIGDIAPGASGSVTFSGYVDASASYQGCMTEGGDEDSCSADSDWAVLNALLFDNSYGLGGQALDWLWADHQIDRDPPEFFGILSPDYFIGAGDTLFKGYAFDLSGVPTLTLETNPPAGGSHQLECADDSPADGAWACTWNAATANGGSSPSDGDSFQIRLQATDGQGQTSAWSGWQTFIVDTVAPTATFNLQTTEKYSGTVVNTSAATFSGRAADNRGLGGAEICVDGDCYSANLGLTTARRAQYDDEPISPVAIGVCGGGEIARTFTVTDSFSLGQVGLGFNAGHTLRDELRVTLSSPDGTSVTVIEPPEGSLRAFQNFDLLLDDAAAVGLHEHKADDDPAQPYYARFSRPAASLSDFYGENAAGTWTLTICDTDGDSESGSGDYNRARLILEQQNQAVTAADWDYTLIGLDEQDSISHTLMVAALDLAGNRSVESQSLTFRVDNVAPGITVSETVDLAATGANPAPVRVLAGTSSDGGAVQNIYATATTPDGDRISLQVGRDGDNWWLAFTPEEAGEYTFWVNAVDLAGNTATVGPYTTTIIWVVAVNDGPTPLGETTTFTATVLGDDEASYTFDFYFKDGDSVIGHPTSVISHTYAAADAYTATVRAVSGTQAFTATTIVLVDEVISGLAASADSPTLIGETTNLTGTISAGTNVAYEWDYGDGQPSAVETQAETWHQYEGGYYTATLTAANAVSVMTATVRVAVTDLSVANDSPTSFGAATTFTATVTTSDPVTYTWAFGDQSPVVSGPLAVVSYTYATFGVFTATVRADTSQGAITETSRVQVLGMNVINDSPTILGTATTFTATMEMDAPITATWNFGDQSPVVSGALVVVSTTYGTGGFYTATITATNGTYTVTDTSAVVVDGAAPTSIISDPVESQTITTTTYLVSGTAADDIQVNRVQVSTDGGTSWFSATGTTTWVYTWTLPIENGISHTLRSRAVDSFGKVETPAAGITITVDNVPPTVTIRAPQTGAILTGTVAMITGTASRDALQVEISTDGGLTWTSATGVENWAFAWTLPAENGVTHTLMARAVDNFNRVGASAPVTVTVDTLGPGVAAVYPADEAVAINSFTTIVITFTESVDPGSLILELLPDPGGWGYSWNADHTRVAASHIKFSLDTLYTATVNASDGFGNRMSVSHQWRFTTGVVELYFPLISR